MPALFRCLLMLTATHQLVAAETEPTKPVGEATQSAPAPLRYESRVLRGWSVLIRLELLTDDKKAETERGLVLIGKQLEDIERLVPRKAVNQMKKVTLWLSPPYGKGSGAEYHPGVAWLKQNGRNPAMVKGVEFSGVADLDKEVLRMPLLTLHELAHAYHDQVLGFDHPEIKACYDRAVASKS